MRTWNILNLGAGVQSTAVYLLACDVKLWGPNLLDFAIFADTGEEPEAVYKHLAWLKSIGDIPIMDSPLSVNTKAMGERLASTLVERTSEHAITALARHVAANWMTTRPQ